MKKLLSDKRAVSVALSTLIITAAVIAAGISVLYWAYSWGDIANQQYSQTMEGNRNATSELVTFEYITYSEQKITVYLINCGQSNDLAVARIYIWDNSGQAITYLPDDPGLKFTANNSRIDSNSLDIGQEGYFTVTMNTPLPPGYYSMRLVTERGRNFDATFSI
ncbi:MAG: hypothetical protein NWF01_03945 [Candidatus Bathyarchaeota archaeon]|nr:hypothetical protein [Candidatus Bathyarchaeota archaeon]